MSTTNEAGTCPDCEVCGAQLTWEGAYLYGKNSVLCESCWTADAEVGAAIEVPTPAAEEGEEA